MSLRSRDLWRSTSKRRMGAAMAGISRDATLRDVSEAEQHCGCGLHLALLLCGKTDGEEAPDAREKVTEEDDSFCSLREASGITPRVFYAAMMELFVLGGRPDFIEALGNSAPHSCQPRVSDICA